MLRLNLPFGDTIIITMKSKHSMSGAPITPASSKHEALHRMSVHSNE